MGWKCTRGPTLTLMSLALRGRSLRGPIGRSRGTALGERSCSEERQRTVRDPPALKHATKKEEHIPAPVTRWGVLPAPGVASMLPWAGCRLCLEPPEVAGGTAAAGVVRGATDAGRLGATADGETPVDEDGDFPGVLVRFLSLVPVRAGVLGVGGTGRGVGALVSHFHPLTSKANSGSVKETG